MTTSLTALRIYLEDLEDRITAKVGYTNIWVDIFYNATNPYRLTLLPPPGIDHPLPQCTSSFDTEEELLTALETVSLWEYNLPNREEAERQAAAKGLARAIDRAREAGIPVEPVAVAFHHIWENLLENKTND